MQHHRSKNISLLLVINLTLLIFIIPHSGNLNILGQTNQNSDWEIIWSRSYGDERSETNEAFTKTSDNNFVLVGRVKYDFLNEDLIILKTDSNGERLWNTTLGTQNFDRAISVIEDSDGNLLISGTVSRYDISNQNDMWLLKFNPNGGLIWNRTYGGSLYDTAYSVIQTSDDGYALAGYTRSFGSGSSDIWLMKIDISGQPEWNRTYGGLGSERAETLIQTDSGGYVLAGTTTSFNSGPEGDAWVLSTDSFGNIEWNSTYGGHAIDVINVVQETETTIVFGGYSSSFGKLGNTDMWLGALDKSGLLLWNQTYGEEDLDTVEDMFVTQENEIIAVGRTLSGGNVDDNLRLFKTNTLGNLEWEYYCCDQSIDSGEGVIQLSDGTFVISGTTREPDSDDTDLLLIKIKKLSSQENEDKITEIIDKKIAVFILTLVVVILIYIIYQKRIRVMN